MNNFCANAWRILLSCCLAVFVTAGISEGQSSRPPVFLPVSQSLATPAAGNQYLIPVVIISYLPTRDDLTLDSNITGLNSSLQDINYKINVMNHQTKFALEEGSRYHGYGSSQASPSLGYRVVASIEVYESMPRSNYQVSENAYRPDYRSILNRFNARDYVESQGVKEFWIWGYHHGSIEPVESNMSSPTTGDVSNSFEGNGDLDVFNKTYTLFNYNYGGTATQAIHNHGHQLERLLSYVNMKQDGNNQLWEEKFMGKFRSTSPGISPDIFVNGRGGWTHMPPNAITDYDYSNVRFVESDIEDWTPYRTGTLKSVNVDTWRNKAYNWPFNFAYVDSGDRLEAQWSTYWRQNIPGLNNGIRYGSSYITNWWQFVGDWDNAVKYNVGLYNSSNRAPLAGDININTYVGKSEIKNLLGYDPDGGSLTFRVYYNARNGISEIKRDTDGVFKLFYTSLNNYRGPDTVYYVAVNSRGVQSNVAKVNINFINRYPSANSSSFTSASGVLASQYISGTDPDNDILTFRLVNNPRYGTGEIKQDEQGKWRVYYRSVSGYVGSDQITFIAIDSRGMESRPVAIISINVVRVPSGSSSAIGSTSPSGENS